MTLTGAQSLGENTSRDYPLGRPLHTFIEAQAVRTPEAVAVTFEGEALSYAELDAQANQLARRLQRLGVGPDVLVGVCLERSLEMVVGLLAVLKAGGAYVPIGPGYPEDRIAFMLGDADPPVLLSQARFRDTLPAHGAKLYLDTDWSEARERSEPVNADVNSENLAYVIYTSGSTGQPKGAMNPHRAIVNRLLWMQEAYPIGPGDAVLQKTPFSFDVSVWEFFWPLMTGARLVVAKPDGHKDANYMADLIQQEGVTVTHFVPSMLYLFLEEANLGERCKSLKHVVCSGEALPFDLQEQFLAKIDAQLHNLYGPTEAAVDVTHWTCRKDSLERVVPIGYPVANTQIYILDENLEPVPDGQEGELHIGGVQVARGYHKRPELTAERFIPDPFSEDPDARLYKTGDLARRRGDGAAEFLGRTDFQVKLRGFRVELGEIEAALNSFRGVKQSVVVAQERAGEMRLVAYLVPQREVSQKEPASRSELNRFLEAKLPDYMVPAVFVNLSELPLSPNGKVDRKRLPEPTRQRPDVERAYAPPRNDLERFLTRLWAQTLDLERVGIYDKFFELGGSSLQAAQFVNRLQKELGKFIYIVTIFGAPSVAEYAAMLKRDYAGAVAKRFGGPAPAPEVKPEAQPQSVTAEQLRDFRKVIPQLELHPEEGPKNPPAIFILAPPRSGTTLLRVMLAGHPKLFAAAELQLLSFNTLAERKEAFTGKFSLWLEGTLRAIMELKNCDADEARRIMADFEARLSTKEFYRVIQTWVGERILVDKSPHYALDPGSLDKAERDFDNALYIHLTRHPYASVKSFENYHMDQVLYLNEHDFGARDLGEMVWTQSHANVLTFLQGVPQERQFRLRYEDLVANPEPSMQTLCERFGLEYHPALVNPYGDIDQKMTDGLYKDSTPMGDTHLLERRSIDAGAADTWRGVESDNFLSEPTWQVAETLRYARPEPSHQAEAANTSTHTSKRHSLERQRQLRQQRRRRS